MQNKNLLIAILAVGVFSILNTEMGIVGLLPMAAERFGIDIVKAGLLVSLFALGVAIAGPTMPLLFSRFNRKQVMLLVLGVFTVCNVAGTLVSDFNALLAARVIPAFFHPVYCALAFSVAASSVAPEDAPKAVAKINMGVAAGMVIGVPISNYLAGSFGFSAAMSFFAVVTALMFVMTLFFVPSMPVEAPLSYGEQVGVLRRPSVWLAIVSVILVNGSIFGVFNYLADYLVRVTKVDASMSVLILFAYGVLNVVGSYLGGKLLASVPKRTLQIFPLAVIVIYVLIYLGAGAHAFTMLGITLFWGILGGVNANINQYLLAQAAGDAPDFSNGLFLTAANIGCVVGTAVCGYFIDSLGIVNVLGGGAVLALLAFPLLCLSNAGVSDFHENEIVL